MRIINLIEITTVLLTASKNFNAGVHSDIYEAVCLKLVTMIDDIELFFLLSV